MLITLLSGSVLAMDMPQNNNFNKITNFFDAVYVFQGNKTMAHCCAVKAALHQIIPAQRTTVRRVNSMSFQLGSTLTDNQVKESKERVLNACITETPEVIPTVLSYFVATAEKNQNALKDTETFLNTIETTFGTPYRQKLVNNIIETENSEPSVLSYELLSVLYADHLTGVLNALTIGASNCTAITTALQHIALQQEQEKINSIITCNKINQEKTEQSLLSKKINAIIKYNQANQETGAQFQQAQRQQAANDLNQRVDEWVTEVDKIVPTTCLDFINEEENRAKDQEFQSEMAQHSENLKKLSDERTMLKNTIEQRNIEPTKPIEPTKSFSQKYPLFAKLTFGATFMGLGALLGTILYKMQHSPEQIHQLFNSFNEYNLPTLHSFFKR